MNAHPGCYFQSLKGSLKSDFAVKITGADLHYSNNNSVIIITLIKIKPWPLAEEPGDNKQSKWN